MCASVVPYAVDNTWGNVYFLMGRESKLKRWRGSGQWADFDEPLHNTVESFASFIKRAGWAREQLYCLNAIQGTGADQLSMLEEAVVAGNNHSTVGFIELGNELFAGDRTLLEPQTCAQTIFPCEKSMSFDFSFLFRMQIQHRQPMHIRWRRG